MEDGGGAGSVGAHFEKLIYGDEIMVSDDTTDAKFGPMSLAVGKDSGWYEIDMETAENYFWGKEQGCKIFEKSCLAAEVSEFCYTKGHQSCSENHMYLTSCSSSAFTGSCNINLNIKSCKKHHSTSISAFSYGHDSICLNTEVNLFQI